MRLTSPGNRFFTYTVGAFYSRAFTERTFTRRDVVCSLTPAATVLTPCAAPGVTITRPTGTANFGSTFKNPPGNKAWQLIDAAGCRGLRVGGAHVSEMHCNFLINEGAATGADVEELGETVRARVKANSGIELEWEIKRLGVAK